MYFHNSSHTTYLTQLTAHKSPDKRHLFFPFTSTCHFHIIFPKQSFTQLLPHNFISTNLLNNSFYTTHPKQPTCHHSSEAPSLEHVISPQNSYYTLNLTQFHLHYFIHKTHLPEIVPPQFISHATHVTQLIPQHPFFVARAALGKPGRFIWSTASVEPRAFLSGRCRTTESALSVAGAALRAPGRCLWSMVPDGPRAFLCGRYTI